MGIFKAYDIRGVYPEELTDEKIYLIGYYLIRHLGLSELKVAHDRRNSYQQVSKFFIEGVKDAGGEVAYLGSLSTPAFYYSLFKGIDSGVMITASHNPKEYNGIKIITGLESFDSRNGLLEVEKLVEEDPENKKSHFAFISDSLLSQPFGEYLYERDIERDNTVLKNYSSYLKDFYDMLLNDEEKDELNNVKFGIDFSSGVASLGVIPFLEKANLNYVLYNATPDGNFPIHSPDPVKAKDFVLNIEEDLDFVAAFDGDGDRIVFFDETKEIVYQDYMIALFIDYFSRIGAKNFVCDLRASKVITDIAEENSAKLKLLRVGRSFYMDYLKSHSCVFGAELSGHMFFRDFHNFDNPDIALIYVLKIYAENLLKNKGDFSFNQMVKGYKVYHRLPETNLEVSDAQLVLDTLREKFSYKLILDIDGYSFDFGNYWFNVRKSNTEPIIRINFEGDSVEETEGEFEEILSYIKSI